MAALTTPAGVACAAAMNWGGVQHRGTGSAQHSAAEDWAVRGLGALSGVELGRPGTRALKSGGLGRPGTGGAEAN